MNGFVNVIVKHRKFIIVIFILITLVCAILQMFVGVNYNLVDYLPPEAQSTKAIRIMDDEFSQAMPNASVMVNDVSIIEALEYKKQLADIEGVSDVLWLDDAADVKIPLRMLDASLTEKYYIDGAALFSVTIEEGLENIACAAIRKLIGDGNALSGPAVDTDFMQNASTSEVINAMFILIPICIIILMLSTDSWIEPLLFLCAIGVSVMINMGTNIFFGQVSFLTNSVSPLLQLAVSMDYAIFLLHSFTDNRQRYDNVEDAMKQAIKSSMTAISASALTTLFGFLALVFMEFKIGADLGIILAKGIIFSFISVVVFLPALTLCIYKVIDCTRHRSLLPNFRNVSRPLSKVAVPTIVIVSLIIVPCFLGQRRTAFVYGAGSAGKGTYLERDVKAIEKKFGKSTLIALLVPVGDIVKEHDLSLEIESLDHVSTVMSYANTVGSTVPISFLSSDITERFYSDNYARIII